MLPAKNKIVVEGVNRVYKHMRPSQQEPPGGPALQGDADRRLQRDARLPEVQPRGPRRPPVHRRRPEAAVLQEVRRQPGQRRPAQAGPRRAPPRRKPDRSTHFVPTPATPDAEARDHAADLKDDGNGSPAGPVQERDRQGDGREVQPRQPHGDPQDRQDRHQHGRRPGHPGQGPPGRRPSTAWARSAARSR